MSSSNMSKAIFRYNTLFFFTIALVLSITSLGLACTITANPSRYDKLTTVCPLLGNALFVLLIFVGMPIIFLYIDEFGKTAEYATFLWFAAAFWTNALFVMALGVVAHYLHVQPDAHFAAKPWLILAALSEGAFALAVASWIVGRRAAQ
jgi:hypothetical protein